MRYVRKLELSLQLEDVEEEYSLAHSVGSIALVMFCSSIGGILFALLGGIHFDKMLCIPDMSTKPILKAITLPPLIGMMIGGCLAKNFFGITTEGYIELWAAYIRKIALCLLLLRGGLTITFRGKGITVVLISFVPQVIEATIIAVISKPLLDMPWPACFLLGFTLSCISPSVLVPALVGLLEKGYGSKKGIPTSLIAAGTFDDIIMIVLNGVCLSLTLTDLEVGDSDRSLGVTIVIMIAEIIIGGLLGVALGLIAFVFNRFEEYKYCMFAKAVFCMTVVIAYPVTAELLHFKNAKYMGSMMFGYTCYQIWGDEKPSYFLYKAWFFLQPLLFGSVGAQLIFSELDGTVVWKSLIIVFPCLLIRCATAFGVACLESKYTMKERLYIALCWSPKATVQATLGGALLNALTLEGATQYYVYGQNILTTSIMSIVYCAPLSAVLMNTFGPILVDKDPEDEEEVEEPPPMTAEEQQQMEQEKESELVIEIVMADEDMEGKQHPVMRTEGECESLELEEGGAVVDIRKKKDVTTATKQPDEQEAASVKTVGKDKSHFKLQRRKSIMHSFKRNVSMHFHKVQKSKSIRHKNNAPSETEVGLASKLGKKNQFFSKKDLPPMFEVDEEIITSKAI